MVARNKSTSATPKTPFHRTIGNFWVTRNSQTCIWEDRRFWGPGHWCMLLSCSFCDGHSRWKVHKGLPKGQDGSRDTLEEAPGSLLGRDDEDMRTSHGSQGGCREGSPATQQIYSMELRRMNGEQLRAGSPGKQVEKDMDSHLGGLTGDSQRWSC